MTGRGAGYCGGSGMPGYANIVSGRGFGRGQALQGRALGGGRGWRNMFYATGLPGWMRFGGYASLDPKANPEMEKQALKNQAEALQAELDLIRKRLGEIESKPEAQQAP
jgi:hypothetical protein